MCTLFSVYSSYLMCTLFLGLYSPKYKPLFCTLKIIRIKHWDKQQNIKPLCPQSNYLPSEVTVTVKLQNCLYFSDSSKVYTTTVVPIENHSFGLCVRVIFVSVDRLMAYGSIQSTLAWSLPGVTPVIMFDGQLKIIDGALTAERWEWQSLICYFVNIILPLIHSLLFPAN